MPLKSDSLGILIDFGKENGATLAPKSCQKSMLTSNGRFSRKPTKTYEKTMFFLNFRTQVGSQNTLKINPKIYSKTKCVLASIFLDFGRFWEVSWGRNGSKNRCKNASKKRCKFRCVLDASWVGVPTDVPWSRGPRPPPLITFFLKKALTNTNAHDTNKSHTPCATSALADNIICYNIIV